MRRVYLIRHAKPDLPCRMCLGSTDIPLGVEGRMQCAVLARRMAKIPVTAVFSSGLSRAIQTARAFCPDPIVIPGLREMDAGEWDGLTFDEIRRRWPEIYAQRGSDQSIPIPGSESAEAGQARFLAALHEALDRSTGDIAVVAHATVIQSLICLANGLPPSQGRRFHLKYASITAMDYDGQWHPVTIGDAQVPDLDESLCQALLTAVGTPERVIAHGRQVRDAAVNLTRALNAAGLHLDEKLIRHAALLHDIARGREDHPRTGAAWLREAGYPRLAELVEFHHDPRTDQLNEETVLFLADKVPIQSRFAASEQKCTTPEAIAAHRRRLEAARALAEQVNARCGAVIAE